MFLMRRPACAKNGQDPEPGVREASVPVREVESDIRKCVVEAGWMTSDLGKR